MKLFTRADAQTTKATLRIFREELQYEKHSFWMAVTLVPFSYFLYIVLIPLFISYIVQVLITNGSFIDIVWLLGYMTVASILAVVANQIGFQKAFEHEERVVSRLLHRALSSLLSHGQIFFSNHKVGSLANDANGFSRSYLALMDTMLMQFSGLAVSYITGLIIIAIISPVLLLPLSGLTVFVVWHSLRSMVQRSVYRNKRKELQSQLIGQVADILGNQTLVRMFGKKDAEIKTIDNERKNIVSIADKEIFLIQQNAKVRQTVLFFSQIVIIGLIAWLYQNKMISIAASIFAITYLVRVISTMFNITSIIRGVEQSFLDAAKITEILGTTPDITDIKNATNLRVNKGSINFQDVKFRYADSDGNQVFNSLSLSIPGGTRIGLVGRSGGGKTTLTNLLLRYHDINGGSITIDDTNIATATQDSLRDAIAFVPQDPYLFHRTLRENIAYGNDSATENQIVAAAKKAQALQFIDKLPKGLDTIVGERGVKLSGGQRQRIAIARAILKDAPILVLDEATSALDSESEKLIQQSLETLMKNRTSIVIAHRLSTIAKLDRIIVLDEGRIVEDGTHTELLKAGKTYAKLWNHQSGGFIEE